jgi:glycosyltransferase involved in cell wall biosynthesis
VTATSSYFVSAVARLHDDADILEPFLAGLARVLQERYENHEIVLVDDGSRDGTPQALRDLLRRIPSVRVLRLSRAFGRDIAITAGLESAIGDYVVTLEPRTDPVELVPELVERARTSGTVVCGIDREWASRPWSRRVGSRLFHSLLRRVLAIEVPERSTYLRVMPRQAVNALVQMRDKSRQFRALTPYIGFRWEPFQYAPRPRTRDRVSLARDAEDAVGIIVSNSVRPLRLVSWLGLGASVLNLLYIGYVVLVSIFKRTVAEGWITLSLQHAGMFFLLFVILTVLTEYVGQTLLEARDRPLYYVREEMNSSVMTAGPDRRNVVNESA